MIVTGAKHLLHVVSFGSHGDFIRSVGLRPFKETDTTEVQRDESDFPRGTQLVSGKASGEVSP